VLIVGVQASLELSLVAHLDVDPLVQTEADEVERLLDGAGRGPGRRRRGPRHLIAVFGHSWGQLLLNLEPVSPMDYLD